MGGVLLRSIILTFILLLFNSLFNLCFAASIAVSPLYYNFKTIPLLDSYIYNGDKSYVDITVTNNLDHTVYVKDNLVRRMKVGTAQAYEVPFDHNPMTFGLIATPTKLVIPAHGESNIRVLNVTKNLMNQRQYYLYVEPVRGEFIATTNKAVHSIDGGMVIKVRYAVALNTFPKHLTEHLSLRRNKNKLFIDNKGNTFVSYDIYDIKCPNQSQQCMDNKSNFLSPGSTAVSVLPFDHPAHVTMMADKKAIQLVSN